MSQPVRVVPFERLRMTDVEQVGGKNASLGEMISQLAGAGIRVPGGFATTAAAFREFLAQDELERAHRAIACAALDVDDVGALARGRERDPRLDRRRAAASRRWRRRSATAYAALAAGDPDASWAVRSSATAEDLPDASFAGQQETFLNINGLENILHAIREVFASLYNDRAIAYRVHKGFAHADVALSAGVQRMVRSDLGAAGVMFTLDTESGFDQVVFITVVVRAGRDRRAGRGESRRVLRLQAQRRGRAAGDPAQDGRRARRMKMVFADDPRRRAARRATVDVPEDERHALLDHRRRSGGARALRDRHREALRPPDGHRMGPRRRRRQALHPAGAARDGEVAGSRRRVAAAAIG